MSAARRLAVAGAMLVLTACSTTDAPPDSEPPAASTAVEPSAPASVIIGDPGSPVSLRPPGHPYDADDILAAMRDSRRPDGVAEELQTEEVAAAVADAIWTLQGDRWDVVSTSGSCEATCTLEIAGSAAGDAGEDVWVLSVDPESAEVAVVEADLHGIPVETADAIDRLARSVDGGEVLDELLLTSVRWHAPPDEHLFTLAYRSGDEEESCSMDVSLDVTSGELTEVSTSGC